MPERYLAISRNVDLLGTDLSSLFDTSLDRCQNACMSEAACRAFTYNQRNGSCFLKSEVRASEPYDGAISGHLQQTEARVLAEAATRRAELGFLSDDDMDAAEDLARTIGRLHSSDERSPFDLLETAQSRRDSGDTLGAHRFFGAALSMTDTADLWLAYGETAAQTSVNDRAEQRRVRARALPAATAAYLRSDLPAQRGTALLQMAEALEAAGRGRTSLAALRLADKIAPRPEIDTALDRAIARYGFRVTGNDVQHESAQPRLCLRFSEDLVATGVDYATYVQLPDPAMSVTSDENQLCVEGVRHGQRVRLMLREGLPAANGEALIRSVEQVLYVRDRSPSVHFPGRAYVLPLHGDAALPVTSVNTDALDLTLFRVSDRALLKSLREGYFGQLLYPYRARAFAREIGAEIWSGQVDIPTELNADTTSRLPLSEALAGQEPGIYVMRAAPVTRADDDDAVVQQWFVVSDHGISTYQGEGGLSVALRRLSDAGPVAGAEVALISRANAVLGRASSDENGLAHFAPGLLRGTGAAAPALVTVTKGDDLSFLSLGEPAFDLSDRGVEGRAPSGAMDLFVTTDRGAYRAGEVIHATALLRDAGAGAVDGLPLTAVLTRPDGVEYSRDALTDPLAGGYVVSLPLAASAPRGTWRLAFYADPEAAPLAETRLLVEDFLPERIDLALDLPARIALADVPELALEARYLFGAPAADLALEGEISLRTSRALEAFPGYVFGPHDAPTRRRSEALPADARTDATGRARVPLVLPDISAPGQVLSAEVTARVLEFSGRPVERQVRAEVSQPGDLIGLRPDFDGVVPEGGSAGVTVLGLGPDLAPKPMELGWVLNRLHTRYQWYQMDGSWNWDPLTTRERIATGTTRTGPDPARIETPVDWGDYELVVTRADGLTTSLRFAAGWYVPEGAATAPDMLDVSLDAERYVPGETARLRLVARAPGVALVSVLADRVIALNTVEVVAGENLIDLPVTAEWGTGAYVAASLIRPLDAPGGATGDARAPVRAVGLAHAAIAPGPRLLDVQLSAPEAAAPRGPLPVTAEISGLAEGEAGYLTLAAIDVGILNLTGFTAPDPEGHFFGQRRLGVEMRDLYGRLIAPGDGAMGRLRSGGDGAGLRAVAPPPTEELMAVFSGPVQVGPDGRAVVEVDLPAFNGTVRLMAVAWSASGVGQASEDVLVRDPVVLTASLPRFLAPGDRSEMLIEMTHAEGPAGEVALSLDAGGLIVPEPLPATLRLPEGGTARLRVPIVAPGRPGLHEIALSLTPLPTDGASAQALRKTLTLPVQINDPERVRQSRFSLAPGETFRFDGAVFDGMRAGTGHAVLSVGPLARFDAPGLMHRLDTYPYGCTEQLTAKALPLLYLGSLARALGADHAQDVDARVNAAITDVLANQARNGGFGLWGPYSGDLWLAAFVSDFLSRARAQGYDVPSSAFEQALANLQNEANYAPDFDEGGEDLAYALMVLAREGRAAIGDLRYYSDEKAGAFPPLAAAQLGAALAFYGEQQRADALFARASDALVGRLQRPVNMLWRADYGSDRRDAAALLALATEARSQAIARDRLLAAVTAPGETLSTQEATWSLLAATALIDDFASAGVTIDGAQPEGPLLHLLSDRAESAPVQIANGGGAPIDVTVSAFGVPEDSGAGGDVGNGFAISRSYYTLEGAPADPAEVDAGARLVAVITVTPFDSQTRRLIVDDPLPAGFEIDNPNLLRSGDIGGLEWLDLADPETAEFRQERFLAALDWGRDDPFNLAYILRAVSPGEYHHPAASVEDMYWPQIRAQTKPGRVRVRP